MQTDQFEYVGFWKRVGVSLLDALVTSPLIYAAFRIDEFAFRSRISILTIIPSLATIALTVFLVVSFGGSVGKLLLGMRVVDANGKYLDPKAAWRRHSLDLLMTISHWILLMIVFSKLPEATQITRKTITAAYEQYGGWWQYVDFNLTWLCLADVLAVACNKHRRALHDYLAGSYVITKRSYEAIQTSLAEDTSRR